MESATTIELIDNNFPRTFQMYKCGIKVRQTTTTEYFDDQYVIDFKN